MRINNNITALNAHRQYGINNASIAKSVEKLSSGYRINRAGDDAAGLAISEKMRAQIRGLNMASKNSQDAVSLVQTAEGALQSTHNILQRMRELAVQSASDTNETGIDRAALQQEFEQLQNEINDISSTTRFNDQNLLDGTFQSKLSSLNTATTSLSNVKTISVARAGAGEYDMTVTANKEVVSKTIAGAAAKIESADLVNAAKKAAKVSEITFAGLETSAHNGNTYTLKVMGSDISNMTFQLTDTNNKIVSTAQNVDASGWSSSNAGVVSFQGVGTMTFNIENGQNITAVADLEALSGAKMSFTTDGSVTKATAASGFAFTSTAATAGVSGLSFNDADNITYEDGEYFVKMTATGTSTQEFVTVTLELGATSTNTTAVAKATVQIARGAGSHTVKIDGFGEFSFKTSDTFGLTTNASGDVINKLVDLTAANMAATASSAHKITVSTNGREKLDTTTYTNSLSISPATTFTTNGANGKIAFAASISSALAGMTSTKLTSATFQVSASSKTLTVSLVLNGKVVATNSATTGSSSVMDAGVLKSGQSMIVALAGYGSVTISASSGSANFTTTATYNAATKINSASVAASAMATHKNTAGALSGEVMQNASGSTLALKADFTPGSGSFQSVGAMSDMTIEISAGAGGASNNLIATIRAGGRVIASATAVNAAPAGGVATGATIEFVFNAASDAVGVSGNIGTLTLTASAAVTQANLKSLKDLTVAVDSKDIMLAEAGVDPITTNDVQASLDLTINGETVKLKKGDTYANFSEQGIAFEFDALSDKDVANANFFSTKDNPSSTVKIGVSNTKGSELLIQTGANQGDRLGINIDRISTETLGLDFSNISNQAAAEKAITEVNDAINQVSTQRAALGALQNRLEYKIANLDTSSENLQAAESRIRDVDMAKEMTQFTKNNILAQASTAMLAQANSLPQGVLQLLG